MLSTVAKPTLEEALALLDALPAAGLPASMLPEDTRRHFYGLIGQAPEEDRPALRAALDVVVKRLGELEDEECELVGAVRAAATARAEAAVAKADDEEDVDGDAPGWFTRQVETRARTCAALRAPSGDQADDELDPSLEFVGSERPGVEFFLAAFVRLPDGRVMSIDEQDLPFEYQDEQMDDGRLLRVKRGGGVPQDEPDGPAPPIEELAAALKRRAELRAAAASSGTRGRVTPMRAAGGA